MDKFNVISSIFIQLIFFPSSLHSSDGDHCNFPLSWQGRWYQKGLPSTINIENSSMTFKGSCREQNRNHGQFLLEDRTLHCVRCLFMIQKHVNILQYRQTYCHPMDNLHNVCALMTSDEILFTMFRIDAKPIDCPFKGHYSFTYNRGRSECHSPVSALVPCSQPSEVLFRFQACLDVRGTESTVEKLTCLAEWKEGANQYLMGRMNHAVAFSHDDQYRCFVYEHLPEKSGFLVSQSADASCTGFAQTADGFRIMTLSHVEDDNKKCQFPTWITGKERWSTLNGREIYLFSKSRSSFDVIQFEDNGQRKVNIRATCLYQRQQFVNDGNSFQAIVHFISGCSTRHVCLQLERKNVHVVEIVIGESTIPVEYERCDSRQKRDSISSTIVADKESGGSKDQPSSVTSEEIEMASSTWRQCQDPFGDSTQLHISQTIRQDPRALRTCNQYSTLRIGCEEDRDKVLLKSACSSSILPDKVLRCIEAWNDSSSTYMLTEDFESKHKLCIRYSSTDSRLSLRSQGSCSEHEGNDATINDELIYNVTALGQCISSNSIRLYSQIVNIFFLTCIVLYFEM